MSRVNPRLSSQLRNTFSMRLINRSELDRGHVLRIRFRGGFLVPREAKTPANGAGHYIKMPLSLCRFWDDAAVELSVF